MLTNNYTWGVLSSAIDPVSITTKRRHLRSQRFHAPVDSSRQNMQILILKFFTGEQLIYAFNYRLEGGESQAIDQAM
jgi:hypothetical protein